MAIFRGIGRQVEALEDLWQAAGWLRHVDRSNRSSKGSPKAGAGDGSLLKLNSLASDSSTGWQAGRTISYGEMSVPSRSALSCSSISFKTAGQP